MNGEQGWARRWAGPVAAALVLGIATYCVTLARTPQALMSAAFSRLAKQGINRFAHLPLATDQSRAVVRPSPDLAYSTCPYDLGGGPVAVNVAPVPANYWSLSVFQANTDAAFVRNNVQSGGGPIAAIIALDGQATPPGVPVVRVKGARGVALIRILVDDRARFPAIDAARRGATCRAIAG